MQKDINDIRILLINGQSINTSNATGITLSALLSNTPQENLFEVCFSEGDLPQKRIKSHIIPESINPIRCLFKYTLGGDKITIKLNHTIRKDILAEKAESIRKKNHFKEIIRAYLDASPIHIDKETKIAVTRFNPDIVYTLGSNIMVLKMALSISRICDSAVLLHFMDNWRESMYLGALMFYPRIKLRNLIKKIEERSVTGLAISDMMANAYMLRSRIEYYPLMNAINKNMIGVPNATEGASCRIVYTGGLHLNRYRSLFDVQTCVRHLNECGYPCTILVYTTQRDAYLKELFDDHFVIFKEYVVHEKIYSVYDSADILLHIESFDEDQMLFTKYSISTKISEYLSSGKPILCYAPKEIAVYQYIKNCEVGYSASSNESLYIHLLKLIQSAELRKRLGSNGINVALTRHTYEAAQEVLYGSMRRNIDARKLNQR